MCHRNGHHPPANGCNPNAAAEAIVPGVRVVKLGPNATDIIKKQQAYRPGEKIGAELRQFQPDLGIEKQHASSGKSVATVAPEVFSAAQVLCLRDFEGTVIAGPSKTKAVYYPRINVK